MVRITTVSLSGEVRTLDVPGTVSSIARRIADARQGFINLNGTAGDQPARLRVADIVLLQLLDHGHVVAVASQQVVPPRRRAS